jgi:hypothetical protein
MRVGAIQSSGGANLLRVGAIPMLVGAVDGTVPVAAGARAQIGGGGRAASDHRNMKYAAPIRQSPAQRKFQLSGCRM